MSTHRTQITYLESSFGLRLIDLRELASNEEIARVVTEAISADFDDVRILDIRVNRDVDFDGDELLRIDVVFEGTPKDLDTRKLSGVVRQVRPRLLDQLGETAFPLFSFVSGGDAEPGKLETA